MVGIKNNWIDRKKEWSFIKNKVDVEGLKLDYEEGSNKIRVFVVEGNTRYFANLFAPEHRFVVGQSSTNDLDYTDFVDNYKNQIDTTPPTYPSEVDIFGIGKHGNKIQIHESSRPDTDSKKFRTIWTGSGDDMETPSWGDSIPCSLLIGPTDTEVVEDIHFHPNFGDVYIHEGYFMWEGAGDGDYVSVHIIASATGLQTSVDLDYEMDGSRVKAASGGPGTGTHGFSGSPVLVRKPGFDGYWNYDGVSLSYASGEDGEYDIYDVDMLVSIPINKVPVNSTATSYIMFQSADTDLLPPGYFLRVVAHNDSGSSWKVWLHGFPI